MTTVYAIMNPKGGVGKSTSAINLATVGAFIDRKVLLIDLDPNMSTTKVFGLNHRIPPSEYDKVSASNLFKADPLLPSDLVVPLSEFGFDMICGSYDMQDADTFLVSLMDGGQSWLFDLLEKDTALNQYDEIIIDTGGRIGRVYNTIAIASDEVLIPAEAATMSLHQVEEIVPFIQEVNKSKRRYFNSEVKVGGVFLNKYRKGTTASKENDLKIQEMLKKFDVRLAKTKLPLATRVNDADSKGKPIVIFSPEDSISMEFQNLYLELIVKDESFGEPER